MNNGALRTWLKSKTACGELMTWLGDRDAVAGRIFDAANGSVTDSAGKIATVPNTRLPAPNTEGN